MSNITPDCKGLNYPHTVDDLILFHQTNPFINLDVEYIISRKFLLTFYRDSKNIYVRAYRIRKSEHNLTFARFNNTFIEGKLEFLTFYFSSWRRDDKIPSNSFFLEKFTRRSKINYVRYLFELISKNFQILSIDNCK